MGELPTLPQLDHVDLLSRGCPPKRNTTPGQRGGAAETTACRGPWPDSPGNCCTVLCTGTPDGPHLQGCTPIAATAQCRMFIAGRATMAMDRRTCRGQPAVVWVHSRTQAGRAQRKSCLLSHLHALLMLPIYQIYMYTYLCTHTYIKASHICGSINQSSTLRTEMRLLASNHACHSSPLLLSFDATDLPIATPRPPTLGSGLGAGEFTWSGCLHRDRIPYSWGAKLEQRVWLPRGPVIYQVWFRKMAGSGQGWGNLSHPCIELLPQ